MNPETERLILNLVAAGCLIIAFLALKFGFADANKDDQEASKQHISGQGFS